MEKYYQIIAAELGIELFQVRNTAGMLEGGATVPFIARYRKELTGNLDETKIIAIRDRIEQLKELDSRKTAILKSLKELEKLTPELEKEIHDASTMAEVEDIYLPYKPKRKTRASIARTKGLEPLAKMIMAQNEGSILQMARKFVDNEQVTSPEDALAGARDIIAEWISEHKTARERIRSLFEREAIIKSTLVKGKDEEGSKYTDYFDYEESLRRAAPHRIHAMLRGENEEFLRLKILVDPDKAGNLLERMFVKGRSESSGEVKSAIEDCYKRLMQPSMENEMKGYFKKQADVKAISVFSENLRQLLMMPALGQKTVLALDPGFRNGCKMVCLDRQGNLLHNETIYPLPPESKVAESVRKIKSLVNAYKIEAIAIGNGTGSRETEQFIKSIRFEKDIIAVIVNESGASIYSVSDAAREEFPEYDVTVRGAASIGRRLIDPLSELVKIDPKSIGVGQYQHDVDQPMLQKSLDDTVISCVNKVGVEVNTASRQLLSYVSGIGPSLAGKIVDYRKKNGPFRSRNDFKKVERFGDKAFEQSAGFLRIRNGENPLDNTAIHPERYGLVKKIAADLGCRLDDLIADKNIQQQIKPEKYISGDVGLPTMRDIMDELAAPGRDPREKFSLFEFDKNIHSIDDVRPGMILPGIINNITAFGAFVDIGVHHSGLLHISEMADGFISDPGQVVKLQQKVQVRVINVDIPRKRISLSLKLNT